MKLRAAGMPVLELVAAVSISGWIEKRIGWKYKH